MTWWQTLLVAFVGSFVGSGTLTAVVQWRFEKERLKIEYRRAKISTWRIAVHDSQDRFQFRESLAYSDMRQFLLSNLITQIEGDEIVVQVGGRGAGDPYRTDLYDDIARIERDWGLT